MPKTDKSDQIIIKKYANRRLYNKATSEYVTLDDLATMVRDDVDFVVVDADGADITQSVLTQIILEQEAKGEGLLPISFLRQLISLYGDSLQNIVPQYLEATMHAFAANQESMRNRFSNTLQDMFQFNSWEEIGKRNMAMFDQAMQMWTGNQADGTTPAATPPAKPDPVAAADDSDLDGLRQQLNELQRRMDALSKSGGDA